MCPPNEVSSGVVARTIAVALVWIVLLGYSFFLAPGKSPDAREADQASGIQLYCRRSLTSVPRTPTRTLTRTPLEPAMRAYCFNQQLTRRRVGWILFETRSAMGGPVEPSPLNTF